MQIEFSSNIRAALAKVSDLSKSLKDKAINSALNDTIATVKTEAVKGIRAEGYNITAAKLKERIHVRKSSKSTLTAKLTAIDKAVNLKHYGAKAYGKVAYKRVNGRLVMQAGGGVSVKVKRERKRIPHAFIAAKSGNVMIRVSHVKDAKGGFKANRGLEYSKGFKFKGENVKQLLGPGVNQVFATKLINTLMTRRAKDGFPKRLDHYLKRLAK